MQAARLDAELLETFYARLRTCPELCEASAGHTCRPPSSRWIRQIHFILRGSGDRDVRWGYAVLHQRVAREVDPTLHLPRCVAEFKQAAITGGSRALRSPEHMPLLSEGDQA
jgi:hypothetical protein